MDRPNTRSYILFKTIVAVILAFFLFLTLLRGCSTNAAAPVSTQVGQINSPTETLAVSPVATEMASLVESTQTFTPSPEPTAVAPTETLTAERATGTPIAPPATVTPEQEMPAAAQNPFCNTTSPSRLGVGQTARVLQRLNVRSEASIRAPIIKVNAFNTQVELTGGPVCEPVGNLAYLWWQIQLPDGTQGWSAETPLNNTGYFLEPVQ